MNFIKPLWSAPKHIKALTSTRVGGVSSPPYDSLNLGGHVGDQAGDVAKNRYLLSESLQHDFLDEQSANNAAKLNPNWLRQEHTTKILQDSNSQQQCWNEAFDGHFTGQKNVVCTIMTADCLPVFICDRKGSEIALVHAGWRGLADGIVEDALELFAEPNDQLLVHCGPGISQQHFEIGQEVKDALGGSDRFYQAQVDKAGHYLADLTGLLGERLAAKGVTFTQSGHCTFAEDDKFFSYRREGVTGRMVSLLWIDSD